MRLGKLVLAAALLLTPTGCITAAMWDNMPDSRGGKVAAVALTPVTVALDAALFAGYVYAESCDLDCSCRCR